VPDAGKTHYELLGLDARATTLQIRAAFRVLVKTAHPDAGGEPTAFRRLKDAHDCLANPLRRKEYDHELGLRVAAAPVGSNLRGWTGPEGDFTGSVEWPSYLRDVVDAPWRPDDDHQQSSSGGDPFQPSYGQPSAPRSPTRVAWQWGGGDDRVDRQPVPAGALVLMSAGRVLAACEVAAGHELWRADLGSESCGAPVALEETVVAVSTRGELQGFDLGRGVLRWRTNFAGRPSALATAGGLVGMALGNRLVAFDASTGKQRWSTRLSGDAVDLAGCGNVFLVRTDRSSLDGIDASKGRHRFALRNVPPFLTPPTLAANLVWVVSKGARIVGLDPATGQSATTLAPGLTVCGLAGGDSRSLLFATVAGPEEVVAVTANGQFRWRCPLPDAALGPAADDRYVYVITGNQQFLTVDRTTGELLAHAYTDVRPVADPVAVPGRLLVRDASATVWALSPGNVEGPG